MILSRNWRGGGGELDLVVRRGAALRFVEVKARSAGGLDPLLSIGPRKQLQLRRAATAWLARHAVPDSVDEVGFSIAVVDLSREPWVVRWWDAPFDA